MNELRKDKPGPIIGIGYDQNRDNKTNNHTQAEMCGFGAGTSGGTHRLYSGVCRSEKGKPGTSCERIRCSRISDIASYKQHWSSSWNGRTFNVSRSNNKTAQSVSLFLDNNAHCALLCTSKQLGGV